jgi:hypothetical protein
MLAVMEESAPVNQIWRSVRGVAPDGSAIVATLNPCGHAVVLADNVDDASIQRFMDAFLNRYLMNGERLPCEQCNRSSK